MPLIDTSVRLVAYGSIALGTWGLIHPRSLTRLMGDDEGLGRWLGARDILVGAALLRFQGPLPVAVRAASDLHDAIRLQRRSPITAVGAAGVAIWGAMVFGARLRAAISEPDRHQGTRR